MAVRSYPDTRSAMHDWFAIDLTNDQIEHFAKMDPDVWEDVKDDYCDTLTRDRFINLIVNTIMSNEDHWPLNMDTGTLYERDFWNRFYAACANWGFVLAK